MGSAKHLEEEIESLRRKLAEAERRLAASRAEDDCRRLIDANLFGFAVWDLHGAVLEANDAFLDIVGYTRDDLANGRLDWRAITPPEHAAKDEAAQLEIASTGRCAPYEKEYVRKDGRRVPVVGAGGRVAAPAHRGGGLGGGGAWAAPRHDRGVCFVLDIGERKRALEALRISNERFELVARATNESIWDWDLETDIATLNPGYQKTFEREDSAQSLAEWEAQIHPSDRERVLSSIRRAIAGEAELWEQVYRHREPGGSYAVVLDRGLVLRGSDGKPLRMIGAMVDITERCELAARLELAERVASMGMVAAGVAHDISTPLMHVLLHVEKAVAELGDAPGTSPRDARLVELLRTALEGVDRVRSIVKDLKTLSRPTTGRREPVRLERVIDTASNLAHAEIASCARLAVSNAPPFPEVLGDDSRLVQLFLNLLLNAAQSIRKAHSDQGEIRVVVSRADDSRVRVDVIDDGAGMEAEVVDRAFDAFFTTKGSEGTGLGLAICQRIVSEHEGAITVKSAPGAGATFTVILPAAPGPTS